MEMRIFLHVYFLANQSHFHIKFPEVWLPFPCALFTRTRCETDEKATYYGLLCFIVTATQSSFLVVADSSGLVAASGGGFQPWWNSQGNEGVEKLFYMSSSRLTSPLVLCRIYLKNITGLQE